MAAMPQANANATYEGTGLIWGLVAAQLGFVALLAMAASALA